VDGVTLPTTRPWRKGSALTEDVLTRHFLGATVDDIVGLHSGNPNGTASWCAVDVDYHSDDDDEEANVRAVFHWYEVLIELGLTPLLWRATAGAGSTSGASFANRSRWPLRSSPCGG